MHERMRSIHIYLLNVLLYTAGTSGSVSFSDLLPGSYILRIKSRARDSDETAVIRRVIHISYILIHFITSSTSAFIDNITDSCDVHLINDGVVITGRSVTIQFYGSILVLQYMCQLDKEFSLCMYT